MSRILLLEDHAPLRASMAHALSGLPGAAVTAVGTLDAAKAALVAARHDLVVSDLDLPDGSGIELMGHEGCGSEIPIIYVSAHLPRFSAQLRDYPGIVVREKPVSVQELQRLATAHLEQAAAEDEAPFGASDYIQLACMGRHSVRIEVTLGPLRGSIIVRDGRLWSASTPGSTGVDALRVLAFSEHSIVRCSTLKQTSIERSNLPDKPWEQLLLDAARQHDEDSRNAVTREIACVDDPLDLDTFLVEDEPPERARGLAPPQVGSTAPIESLADVLDRAAEALLSKDYPAALRAYERAHLLDPDDRMVLANVARLTQLVGRG